MKFHKLSVIQVEFYNFQLHPNGRVVLSINNSSEFAWLEIMTESSFRSMMSDPCNHVILFTPNISQRMLRVVYEVLTEGLCYHIVEDYVKPFVEVWDEIS